MLLKMNKPLVFFDIESTGTNIATDKIVEIYFKKVYPDETEDDLHLLINPGRKIPQEASDIHGITDEMVNTKPTFDQVAGLIWDYINNCDLAGYNIRKFDIPMLGQELNLCNCNLDLTGINIIDSYDIVVKEYPRTLSAMFKHYVGIDFEKAHQASSDVDATITVFWQQLAVHDSIRGKSVDEISAFCEGGKKLADHAGKIYLKDGQYYFNFGKHIDRLVIDEPSYVDWILQSKEFTGNTKSLLRKILQNGR